MQRFCSLTTTTATAATTASSSASLALSFSRNALLLNTSQAAVASSIARVSFSSSSSASSASSASSSSSSSSSSASFSSSSASASPIKGRLQGKVALVTGGARGLGKSISEVLAKEGAHVVITDINQTGASDVAKHLKPRALAIPLDVTNEMQVEDAVEKTVKEFGRIDILVSNAGHQTICPIVDLSYIEWQKMIKVHLDAAFLLTRTVLRHMIKSNTKGKIIYMGSIHSKEASVLKSPYVSAKHGIVGLCRTVAKEMGPHGISANVVCPGFVRTELVEKQIPEQAQRLGLSEEQVIKNVMLVNTVDKEFTTVQDVADAVLFFAAHPNNSLTGQTLNVSHGWNMS